MLEVTDLQFDYGNGQAQLQGISLTARRGHITALLGPNGAGKTTLFRCILGALRPTHGRIAVDGIALHTLSTQARARCIAYVPQEWHSPFRFGVLEAVLMGRTAHLGWLSAPRAADVEQAQTLLHRLGIGHLASRGIDQISGGERQLALLARALLQQATVLLLDEPTAHLDLHHQLQIFAHLKNQVKRDHLAAFITLHDPNLAAQFADTVVLLKEGRLVSHGSVQEILTATTLAALYGTPVEATLLGGRPIFRGQVSGSDDEPPSTPHLELSVKTPFPNPSHPSPIHTNRHYRSEHHDADRRHSMG